MKTKPKKSIKKLSEAIVRGAKIAKENGIKQGTGELIVRDRDTGKIECACALGMGLIGKFGLDVEGSYSILADAFKTTETASKCLINTVSPNHSVRKTRRIVLGKTDVEAFVFVLNDAAEMAPEKIASKLEKCGY
jgi:hypothetical protein